MKADSTRELELGRHFAELGEPVAGYSREFGSPPIVVAAVLGFVGWFLLLHTTIGTVLLTLGLICTIFWVQEILAGLRSMPYRICPRGVVAIPWKGIEIFRWTDVGALQLLRKAQSVGGNRLIGGGTLSAIVTCRD